MTSLAMPAIKNVLTQTGAAFPDANAKLMTGGSCSANSILGAGGPVPSAAGGNVASMFESIQNGNLSGNGITKRRRLKKARKSVRKNCRKSAKKMRRRR